MGFNVYVPSKGRPDSLTANQLRKAGMDFIIVVEPGDANEYSKKWEEHMLVLDRNNAGISYVRQAILNHAKSAKVKWFWMIDDDIMEWWKRSDGVSKTTQCTCVRSDISMLNELECIIESGENIHDQIGQVGLYHCCWACKPGNVPERSYNVGIVQVVAMNASIIDIKYDSKMDGMEDQDFTLRLLYSGIGTLRFNHYAFKTPRKGMNKGGLYDHYITKGTDYTASDFYSKHSSLGGIMKWNEDKKKLRIYWQKSFGINL